LTYGSIFLQTPKLIKFFLFSKKSSNVFQLLRRGCDISLLSQCINVFIAAKSTSSNDKCERSLLHSVVLLVTDLSNLSFLRKSYFAKFFSRLMAHNRLHGECPRARIRNFAPREHFTLRRQIFAENSRPTQRLCSLWAITHRSYPVKRFYALTM